MTDLNSFLDGPARPEPAFAEPTGRDATAYALKALAGECENVHAVNIGDGRNHQLNISALKMGGLVAAGAIDEKTVYDALCNADGGDHFKATRDTVMSGLTAGMQRARAIPERELVITWLKSPDYDATRPPSDDPFSANFVAGDSSRTPTESETATTSTPGSSSSSALVAHGDGSTPPQTISELVRERLPLIDWSHLFTTDTHEEWIVAPLLPARRQIALYSAPKVGKSLLLLELAVAVARGTEMLGHTIDRPRRVLYVDFENDPEGDIRTRLINMGHTVKDAGPWGWLDRLCYLSYPSIAKFDSARGAAELVAALKVYECEVVIIDTISRAIEGEENANDTWLNFYRHTGLEMKRLGVAMIRLDHSGKDDAAGMRGGSAKYGDVDAVWRLSRVTPGSNGNAETFRLVCEAHRFPIPETDRLITFERLNDPLRHKVNPRGAADAINAEVEAYIEDNDISLTIGVNPLFQLLKGTEIKASNESLRKLLPKLRLARGLDPKTGREIEGE